MIPDYVSLNQSRLSPVFKSIDENQVYAFPVLSTRYFARSQFLKETTMDFDNAHNIQTETNSTLPQ